MLSMSEPPQNCRLPLRMAAMKGNWWFLATHPFTMYGVGGGGNLERVFNSPLGDVESSSNSIRNVYSC